MNLGTALNVTTIEFGEMIFRRYRRQGEARGMMRHPIAKQTFTLLGFLFLLGATGCQTLPSQWNMPWEKESEPVLPDRILAVWSDTVLHQPGQPGVRGFGGRLFFYVDDDPEPVKVDGGLMIYVFDAETYDPSHPEPLKRYAYTPDQTADLYSRAPLGHSYSVWLPWDEVGGMAQSLSLVVKFEGREGGTVISDSVVKLLPGLPREVARENRADDSYDQVRQVGYVESTHGTRPRDSRSIEITSLSNRGSDRRVETIDLPPSFSRHLQPQRPPSTSFNAAAESPTRLPSNQPTTSDPSIPASNPSSLAPYNTGENNTGADVTGTGNTGENQSGFNNFVPPLPDSSAATAVESPVGQGDDTRLYDSRFSPRRRAGSMGSSPYRTYPGVDPNAPVTPSRTIRTQPFPAGWLSGR